MLRWQRQCGRAAAPEIRGSGRRIGMRLWLGAAFAGVTLITAVAVYIFVDDSSGRTLQSESADLAVGPHHQPRRPASRGASNGEAAQILNEANTETFEVWAVNRSGGPFAAIDAIPPADLRTVEQAGQAVRRGRAGGASAADLSDDRTIASAPIFGDAAACAARWSPSRSRRPALTGPSTTSGATACGRSRSRSSSGVLVGFVVSSLIAIRVKRLARSAEQMAAGRFDVPLPAGGERRDRRPDPLAGHACAEALRDSFDMLATERDRLSAIFDGLREARDRGRRGRRGPLLQPRRPSAGPPTASRRWR